MNEVRATLQRSRLPFVIAVAAMIFAALAQRGPDAAQPAEPRRAPDQSSQHAQQEIGE